MLLKKLKKAGFHRPSFNVICDAALVCLTAQEGGNFNPFLLRRGFFLRFLSCNRGLRANRLGARFRNWSSARHTIDKRVNPKPWPGITGFGR